MTRPTDLLRRLWGKPVAKAPTPQDAPSVQRQDRLDAVRPVSVSRAVLFRARPERQEA